MVWGVCLEDAEPTPPMSRTGPSAVIRCPGVRLSGHGDGSQLAGAEVLGFRGLLLDRNLVIRRAESDASTEQTVTDESDEGVNPAETEPTAAPPAAIDFFCRLPDRTAQLTAQDLLSDWLGETLRSFLKQHEIEDAQCLEIGPKDPSFPAAIVATRNHSPIAWAATESLQSANVIAMTTEVETDAWPEPTSPTLVVDLSHRPNEIDQLRSLGYQVVGNEEIRIGILTECLQRWTGQVPPEEVLTEAIEEYLAV